ncbi:MAG: outer membrane lipoprotein-sorting protein [Pseudomonadota bacterium]
MNALRPRADDTRALFRFVVRNAWKFMLAGLIGVALMGAGLMQLEKEPSTDSLIPQDDPSITMRDRAEEIFGLRDPVIVAVAATDAQSVFTPDGLALIASLHREIEAIDVIRADRVASIASESQVGGSPEEFRVDRFYEQAPKTIAGAEAVRDAVNASPPHVGSLVSQDGRMALIVAELYDENDGDPAYQAARAIAEATETPGYDIHVAGEGAVTGYLSASIDDDGKRLPAIAGVLILLIVLAAFRDVKALIPLLVVIAGAVAGSIGLMSWLGIKYYVITSALPIILIAIAVADTIHILSGYFSRRAVSPETPVDDIIVETMVDLWRPLTLTTLTTMAGFLGIALASIMPPLAYFGWFALIGTFLAWGYSLLVLPAIMALVRPSPSPMIVHGRTGWIASVLTKAAGYCAARPAVALAGVAIIMLCVTLPASAVKIDTDRIQLFGLHEPIRTADVAINERMAGTSYLDVVIETDEAEGLLSAERAAKISALQDFMTGLPNVNKARAFTDVVSEINQVIGSPGLVHDGRPASRSLPGDDDALAQQLLLYEASGDPEDIADEIDMEYRYALVRGFMDTRTYTSQRPAVEALGRYLETEFNEEGMTGALSGRVNVDHNWMKRLGDSHVRSVILSLALVFLVGALLFRSAVLGVLSVTPVLFAILSVYALMGAVGIFIEPSTSMFAAIAIGVGVDFAVHFIDRIDKGVSEGLSVPEAIAKRFPTSARACFINAAALGLGFSVLMSSALPTVMRFGLLIAVAAAASFIAGLVLTCAILALIHRRGTATQPLVASRAAVKISAVALAALLLTPAAPLTAQSSQLSADQIAKKVYDRAEGDRVERTLAMTKTTRGGSVQRRQAMSYRSGGSGERRSLIVYTGPRSIRETAFMTHDSARSGGADRRWLYLPARGSAMRIPDAERGKYFLGTGFSYEDIKSELKFSLDDYTFAKASVPRGGSQSHVGLKATPRSSAIARELGYGSVHAAIDPTSWMPRVIVFNDTKGKLLKTVTVSNVRRISGIWTVGEVAVEHHQKGHKTVFAYSNVSYGNGPGFSEFLPENLSKAIDW